MKPPLPDQDFLVNLRSLEQADELSDLELYDPSCMKLLQMLGGKLGICFCCLARNGRQAQSMDLGDSSLESS